jgi:regulator of sigma E protease
MSWLIAILGLAFLILIHEAGHFFTARAVGMRPRRFYLGFPPALAKVKRNGIEYGIGAIPLGGYVKIPGMHRPAASDLDVHLGRAVHEAPELLGPMERAKRALDRQDFEAARAELPALERALARPDLSAAAQKSAERGIAELRDATGADAYWRAPAWKKIAVIFAGPGTNLVFCVLMLAIVFTLGVRQETLTVREVSAAYPAQLAGLRPGDRIVAVDGKRLEDFDELFRAVQDSEGREIRLVVERGGNERPIVVTPTREMDGRYLIGFRPGSRFERRAPDEALGLAVGRTWEVTKLIGEALARLARGEGREDLSSPVGITQVSSEAVDVDFRIYLQLLAFISLSLAIFNLLPLLPLDGGHIAFSLIEAARRRAVGREVYERVSVIGIALVLMLFFIGLSNDIGGRGPG